MNSSHFMDKQIMDLSAGGGGGGGVGELFDLMNPQEENHGNGGGSTRKEEILPSYDFQPIRTVGSSPSIPSSSTFTIGGGSTNLDAASATRHSWGPSDSNIASPPNLRYANLEPRELAKVGHDKDNDSYHVATITEIDRTVKKYADNLLHALEGVGARLTQLESRTHHLESSVDELKVSIGNNSGSNDGKLRQLENIVREVRTGVQVLRDKQEIAEAQVQLTKLQQPSSKADHYQSPNEPPNTDSRPESRQQQSPAPAYQPPPPPLTYQPPPPHQAPPPPVAQLQPPPQHLPAPNAPPPPLQQNPTQYPPQFAQTQLPSREPSYFPPQPSQAQQPPLQRQYQSPQYSQPMPPSQSVNPSSQLQPPLAHHPEESAPYMPQPPQTYPPNIHQPPPTSGPQYYGPGYAMQPTGPAISDPYPYSGSPSHYNSLTMKPSPFSNSPPPSVGGSSYPRLPTAKILPQAAPTGSSSGGAPGGNRVPVDDVVDKVSTMGFSREQVKAAVRKLTENGQSVDLNVVLDKLMNEGGEMVQPQKGWFGR